MELEEQNEFMLSGKVYNDMTDEIILQRQKTFELLKEYNESYGRSSTERENILKKILKSVGNDVNFTPDFHCEFGYNISIGNHFFGNFDCIMLDAAKIEIGDNVLFGPRVGIYTANHAKDATERNKGVCYAKPVKIENNVWVGAGTNILSGVTIGENSIIGTGSIVTKDIPANVVAVGAPCRPIHAITEEDKTTYGV